MSLFFGTPRSLGRATATASASFFPHCEQRSRGARAPSVVDQPTKRARALGFDVTLGVARGSGGESRGYRLTQLYTI